MATKLPTAKKLPSGHYRCQVMVNGKRVSVVEPTAKAAQAKAVALRANLIQQQERGPNITVGEAIDRRIATKDAILSPATILEYKRIRRSYMQELMNIPVMELTQEQIQAAVNRMAKTLSPKSVRGAHSLLTSTLAEYRPNFMVRTVLPKLQKTEIKIPTTEEIQKIAAGAKGDRAEIPILLAIWLGLRMSEIRGLTWDCIHDGYIHIKQASVKGENGYVVKSTKTTSGTRTLRLPKDLESLLNQTPHTGKFVTNMPARKIYDRFVAICKKAGLPHFRFHDLRHYNASIMLSLGIPDKYAMERMGHATNNMLKTVYQHTMSEKRKEVDDTIDHFLSEKLHTNLHTKN